jgi:2-methylisocitrate lyase-like PEP mutase family enzyme
MAPIDSPRRRFRQALDGSKPVFAPLCLDPLNARLIERAGLEAGYLSGGALGFQYAVGEALLSFSEIAEVARRITARSSLPLIVDGGVGFGDAVHAARATTLFEATGAVAVEFEDQVAPKRLHHHVGVEHLVETAEMVSKIEAAVSARTDPDFLVIARTGGVRHEGLAAGLARLEAYHDAGADVLMTFGSEDQLADIGNHFAGTVRLSTITGLDHHTPEEWKTLGWHLIIDAFTSQALAVRHTQTAYERFVATGHIGAGDDGGRIDGMALHRELVDLCGLDEFLAIERATTEAPNPTTGAGSGNEERPTR